MRSMRRFAQFLTLFMVAVLSAHAVPAVLNYAGQVAVNGQPFDGQGLFKFALVNRAGTVSYWTNDGNFTLIQEPPTAVAVTLTDGVYSVPLGDASLTNMQAIPDLIFKDHNDAHLRIWIRLGSTRMTPWSGLYKKRTFPPTSSTRRWSVAART